VVDAGNEYKLPGHFTHALLPVTLAYFPASQVVQVDAPDSLKRPMGQMMHPYPEPEVLVPAAQIEQSVAPDATPVENPGGQSRQASVSGAGA
jgi:hypothetical protein